MWCVVFFFSFIFFIFSCFFIYLFFSIFFVFFFIFFHFLSFSITFYHFLSFLIIFYHFLSFSFIFFFFVGCSESDFFGPQFRYDFCRQFSCEKSIFGPIPGGTPLGPLFLFFLLFFSRFFVFFLLFIFSFFSFLFISLFFFLVFHFPFSFSEEKVSSFLCSCISFEYVFIAGISIRVLTVSSVVGAMEVWCPDDIGLATRNSGG